MDSDTSFDEDLVYTAKRVFSSIFSSDLVYHCLRSSELMPAEHRVLYISFLSPKTRAVRDNALDIGSAYLT
ncbi:hypothetical protein J6590_035915 [Homalodisca vitripennis]|nr:hypothetical protein J6590_089807 [Homalodisca vitripennis]KAG8311831.1 hypothetical protein J6590_035915 [Homalodisca vitripennis]